MDKAQFLQTLCELSLEEGRAYMQAHLDELSDHKAIGNLIAEEALRQLYIAPFVSLKLSELLIFFGEQTQHTFSHALGLKAKGDALRQIGLYQAAIECLDVAGEEFLRLQDEENWARTRIAWILASTWVGRAEEALQHAARAREIFLRLGSNYWACVIDHNTAMIYTRLGHYQDALSLYKKILSIYPTLTDQSEDILQRAIAMAEGNLAINIFFLGDFAQSFLIHRRVQAKFMALGEMGAVVKAEMHLAEIDYAQGYYGSALRRYYQAHDSFMHNNLQDPHMLSDIMLRTAACLVKINRSEEACQLARKAVEICRRQGISLDTGDALREYATTLVASQLLEEALVALDEAYLLFDRGGFDHYASVIRLQQAELRLKKGAAAEAYDEARNVKLYFDTKGLVARSVQASLVMAGALVEGSRQSVPFVESKLPPQCLQEATWLCEQVTDVAHRYNLQEESYQNYYLLGQIAEIQENVEGAIHHYEYAIAQIEHILDDLVHDLSPSFLNTAGAVYGDMITLCLKQSRIESAFRYLERARSLTLRQYLSKPRLAVDEGREVETEFSASVLQANRVTLLQMQHELETWQQQYRKYSTQLASLDAEAFSPVSREAIEAELKRCEAKIGELFERLHLHRAGSRTSPITEHEMYETSSIDIEQLRRLLAPEQLLLAYYIYKEKLITFAITQETLVTHENPEGVGQLERLLPLLHAHLEPRGWPSLEQPPQQPIRRLLKKLYDLLVAPVKELLPAYSGYLTIVPYGPLHKLPLHALYDGSHFLVEDFQINYLPASSVLLHLNNRRNERNRNAADSTLATSERRTQHTTSPLVFGYSGNGSLPRAVDEAKELATLLEARCYLEEDATITRLIEQAPSSSIIHLATHGQSRLDAPNFSSIRLADGQFNAIDAFNLDLERCELVTLSGCETGLAQSGGGDEQLGLGRAFLAAGASSLVMSLWPVEDNATNKLMQYFYQRLLIGDTRVQALRAAQCHLLQQSSQYGHPYFWAAFRLVGDVGPLRNIDINYRFPIIKAER